MKNKLLFYTLFSLFAIQASAVNTWQTKAPLPAGIRAGNTVFGIGNIGYTFGGLDANNASTNDLWSYDPLTDQWSQLATFPGPSRYGSAACVVGDMAFLGTGAGSTVYYTDWWQYNSTLNAWTQKSNFPGGVRKTFFALSINGKCYAGMGIGSTWYADWYEYNPANDSWIQKSNFPSFARQNGVGFGIGNYGYVGLGSANNVDVYSDMYKYDPSNDSWTQVASYPLSGGIFSPGFFTIGDKAFVCGGYDYANLNSECYEYDATQDLWTAIASFSNVSPARYFQRGFAIGGKGYLVGGSIDVSNTSSGYRNDLIEYTSKYVGVEEINKSDLKVYYEMLNHELVFFSSGKAEDFKLLVYDNNGQIISRISIENILIKREPLDLAPGIYFYNVESKSKKIKTGKFVVME